MKKTLSLASLTDRFLLDTPSWESLANNEEDACDKLLKKLKIENGQAIEFILNEDNTLVLKPVKKIIKPKRNKLNLSFINSRNFSLRNLYPKLASSFRLLTGIS